MADSPASRPAGDGPPGVRLSREVIIERAIALIDDDGVGALTMRRLGAALGVEGMSLYSYVNSREDLLQGVVEQLVDSIAVEPGTRTEPGDGWQFFLARVAHDVHRLAQAHPNAFALIASRPPAAPWLRPPLRSVRVVDAFLGGLCARGLTDRQAVTVYRLFSSVLLGHLLLERTMCGAGIFPVGRAAAATGGGPAFHAVDSVGGGELELLDGSGRIDLADYPTVTRLQCQLQGHLTKERTDAAFQEALAYLFMRLTLEMSRYPPP